MDDDDDDPVGYGKPPKKHRFRKGNQMARRRKGKTGQSFEKMLNKKLHEKVNAVRNGRTVRITLLEALLERMVKLATSGSARDLISVLNYVRANLPEALASPGDSGMHIRVTYVAPDPDTPTPPGCLEPPPDHLLPPELRRKRK